MLIFKIMDEQQTTENVVIEEKVQKSNGEVLIRKYQRGKTLGKGGFAKCYEITQLDSKRVLAAKIIAKGSLTKNRARQKVTCEA